MINHKSFILDLQKHSIQGDSMTSTLIILHFHTSKQMRKIYTESFLSAVECYCWRFKEIK